jgi:hypothetical protein
VRSTGTSPTSLEGEEHPDIAAVPLVSESGEHAEHEWNEPASPAGRMMAARRM